MGRPSKSSGQPARGPQRSINTQSLSQPGRREDIGAVPTLSEASPSSQSGSQPAAMRTSWVETVKDFAMDSCYIIDDRFTIPVDGDSLGVSSAEHSADALWRCTMIFLWFFCSYMRRTAIVLRGCSPIVLETLVTLLNVMVGSGDRLGWNSRSSASCQAEGEDSVGPQHDMNGRRRHAGNPTGAGGVYGAATATGASQNTGRAGRSGAAGASLMTQYDAFTSRTAFVVEQTLWFLLAMCCFEITFTQRLVVTLFFGNTLHWSHLSSLGITLMVFYLALLCLWQPAYSLQEDFLSFANQQSLLHRLYTAYSFSFSATLFLTDTGSFSEARAKIAELIITVPQRIRLVSRQNAFVRRVFSLVHALRQTFFFINFYFFVAIAVWSSFLMFERCLDVSCVGILCSLFALPMLLGDGWSESIGRAVKETVVCVVFYSLIATAVWAWIPSSAYPLLTDALCAVGYVLYMAAHCGRSHAEGGVAVYVVVWLAMVLHDVFWWQEGQLPKALQPAAQAKPLGMAGEPSGTPSALAADGGASPVLLTGLWSSTVVQLNTVVVGCMFLVSTALHILGENVNLSWCMLSRESRASLEAVAARVKVLRRVSPTKVTSVARERGKPPSRNAVKVEKASSPARTPTDAVPPTMPTRQPPAPHRSTSTSRASHAKSITSSTTPSSSADCTVLSGAAAPRAAGPTGMSRKRASDDDLRSPPAELAAVEQAESTKVREAASVTGSFSAGSPQKGGHEREGTSSAAPALEDRVKGQQTPSSAGGAGELVADKRQTRGHNKAGVSAGAPNNANRRIAPTAAAAVRAPKKPPTPPSTSSAESSPPRNNQRKKSKDLSPQLVSGNPKKNVGKEAERVTLPRAGEAPSPSEVPTNGSSAAAPPVLRPRTTTTTASAVSNKSAAVPPPVTAADLKRPSELPVIMEKSRITAAAHAESDVLPAEPELIKPTSAKPLRATELKPAEAPHGQPQSQSLGTTAAAKESQDPVVSTRPSAAPSAMVPLPRSARVGDDAHVVELKQLRNPTQTTGARAPSSDTHESSCSKMTASTPDASIPPKQPPPPQPLAQLHQAAGSQEHQRGLHGAFNEVLQQTTVRSSSASNADDDPMLQLQNIDDLLEDSESESEANVPLTTTFRTAPLGREGDADWFSAVPTASAGAEAVKGSLENFLKVFASHEEDYMLATGAQTLVGEQAEISQLFRTSPHALFESQELHSAAPCAAYSSSPHHASGGVEDGDPQPVEPKDHSAFSTSGSLYGGVHVCQEEDEPHSVDTETTWSVRGSESIPPRAAPLSGAEQTLMAAGPPFSSDRPLNRSQREGEELAFTPTSTMPLLQDFTTRVPYRVLQPPSSSSALPFPQVSQVRYAQPNPAGATILPAASAVGSPLTAGQRGGSVDVPSMPPSSPQSVLVTLADGRLAVCPVMYSVGRMNFGTTAATQLPAAVRPPFSSAFLKSPPFPSQPNEAATLHQSPLTHATFSTSPESAGSYNYPLHERDFSSA